MGLKIPETSACTHLNDEFLGTLGKCIVEKFWDITSPPLCNLPTNVVTVAPKGGGGDGHEVALPPLGGGGDCTTKLYHSITV